MIHSTAIIDPSAKIGKDVAIGPYCVIGPDVTLGDRCQLHSHVVIEHTSMGPDCIVSPFVSLGLPPQHLKYKGEKTSVEIGARCTFREGVTVHRGTLLDKGVTRIGNDNYFMALSHVAHDCRIGNKVILANGAQLAGHVEVGDFVFLSSTLGIHQFVRIGTGALVSGGAMVTLDVAPYCIAQGDRAALKGLNVVGLRRMGVDRESIKLIRTAFRVIFQSGLPLEEALQQPELRTDNKYVTVFREFLDTPKRGFTRPNTGVGKNTLAETEEVLA